MILYEIKRNLKKYATFPHRVTLHIYTHSPYPTHSLFTHCLSTHRTQFTHRSLTDSYELFNFGHPLLYFPDGTVLKNK